MYICQYCRKEVPVIYYDPVRLNLDVCSECYEILGLQSVERNMSQKTVSRLIEEIKSGLL
jgi:hypothetical protein